MPTRRSRVRPPLPAPIYKKNFDMSDLANKKCVPCRGGIPGFDITEIHKYLKKVDGWDVKKKDNEIYFLEKNFDDLVEYSIMLPRMFKKHERYVLNMEKDKPCSFGNFTNKVELWKKATGIM